MSMEFKEQMTPTLTLDSFEETEKTETTAAEFQEPVQKMEMQEKIVEENPLSAEEKQMVEDFARQINLDDSAAILRYGSGTQKKMADFSETALEKVKTKDLGEVGDLITGVVNELKGFDATEEKGLFGFFKKGKTSSKLSKQSMPK